MMQILINSFIYVNLETISKVVCSNKITNKETKKNENELMRNQKHLQNIIAVTTGII